MAAFRSGLDPLRGVCGSSVTEEAWDESAANRRRGGLRGEHGAAALGAGVVAEIRAQGEARHEAGGV